MKLAIAQCLAASVVIAFSSGCAMLHGRHDDQPVFVDRRSVVIDNQPRYVRVYRSGETYFYIYDGRSYTLTDPPYRTTRMTDGPSYASGVNRRVEGDRASRSKVRIRDDRGAIAVPDRRMKVGSW